MCGALHPHAPKKLLKIKTHARQIAWHTKKSFKIFLPPYQGPQKNLTKFQKSFCHLTRGTKKTIKSKNPPIQRGDPKKYSKLQKPKKNNQGPLNFSALLLESIFV